MKHIDPRIGIIFKLSQKEINIIKNKLRDGDIIDENWMKKMNGIDDMYSDKNVHVLSAFDTTIIDDEEQYEKYKDNVHIEEFETIIHHIFHEKASLDDFCVLTRDCYSIMDSNRMIAIFDYHNDPCGDDDTYVNPTKFYDIFTENGLNIDEEFEKVIKNNAQWLNDNGYDVPTIPIMLPGADEYIKSHIGSHNEFVLNPDFFLNVYGLDINDSDDAETIEMILDNFAEIAEEKDISILNRDGTSGVLFRLDDYIYDKHLKDIDENGQFKVSFKSKDNISRFMKQVPEKMNHGIITLNVFDIDEDDSFVMSSAFNIDYDHNFIVWENPYVALCLMYRDIIGDLSAAIILRVFNDKEDIGIINGYGEEIIVPRKFVGSWFFMGDTFTALDASETSEVSSIDSKTGDLIAPEEGVDYFGTKDVKYSRIRG